MKFLISAKPVLQSILEATPQQLINSAQLTEQLGFWGIHYEDHPVPTKTWLEQSGQQAMDPFILLSLIGQSTQSIKLLTNMCIGSYRNLLC